MERKEGRGLPNPGEFFIVNKSVIEDENLSVSDKMVYVVLSMYTGNNNKKSFPSVKLISKKSGCGERTVRNSINNLMEKGYIEIRRRKNREGGNLTNEYKILR